MMNQYEIMAEILRGGYAQMSDGEVKAAFIGQRSSRSFSE